jgi:thioredoxin-related protein
VWAVPDFFDTMKQHFMALDCYPVDSRNVDFIWLQGGPITHAKRETAQRIFRAHGWPNLEVFRKAECLEALADAMAKLNH